MMSSSLFRKTFVRNECLTLISTTSRRIQHCYRNYSQPKFRIDMNEAFVNYDRTEGVFNISFRYVNSDLKVDRQFNFRRQANDTVNNFLARVDQNIARQLAKKLKRRKKEAPVETTAGDDNIENNKIRMLQNDTVVRGDLTCKTVLDDPSNLKLVIFDTEYTVKRNVPTITSIALPSSILVGFPTYPSKLESIHMDKAKSEFTWHKADMFAKGALRWIRVGEGYIYVPDMSDIGCKLQLVCLPKNDVQTGATTLIESTGFVEAGPGACPFDGRHAFTREKLSGKSFRITSYNILADVYTNTDYTRDVLFPYCPTYALSIDYRKLLILKELIGFNSDIICLQEVDSKVYQHDLMPSLSTLNYDSVHNTKNEQREGLAIFFDRERFEKLDCGVKVLSKDLDLNEFSVVWSRIRNEKLKARFLNRSTIVQSAILASKENLSEILIVGNTHLYFRPDADQIRLLQSFYAITYLQKLAKETKEKNPDCNVSIILCGDFNSTPECGVYRLMTENFVPEDSPDWKSNPEEIVQNVSLRHDLSLSSACGTPEYTNYTPGFSGCLDYIFYEKNHLEIEQVIPIPSKEELVVHKGLPSVVFPSDHISLCADLKWRK